MHHNEPATTEATSTPDADQGVIDGAAGHRPEAPVPNGRTRTARRAIHRAVRGVVEWIAVAIGALAVALLIKTYLVQAFYIPSESMTTTLQVDDRVLVNKLSYRLGDPSRGDIVVFHKPPSAPGQIQEFIKRVIAEPGETISFADGMVFIDGQPIDEPYTQGTTNPGSRLISSPGCSNPAANDRCTLAEGYYFVMGDNRLNSTDSRVFGPIEKDEIIGRAFVKVWPLGNFGFL